MITKKELKTKIEKLENEKNLIKQELKNIFNELETITDKKYIIDFYNKQTNINRNKRDSDFKISGIGIDCRGSVGGISTVYLGNLPKTENWFSITNGIVTSFNDVEFFEYKPNKESSFFIEYYNRVDEYIFLFKQVIDLKISSPNSERQEQINKMSGSNLVIIIKDNLGKYFIIGSENGAVLSGGTLNSGKKYQDGNIYSLEFISIQKTTAYEVDEKAIEKTLNK